jgi:hypothetical protein
MTYWKSVGVTATREGLSPEQNKWIKDFLNRNGAAVMHHGDCIGGDEELAEIFSNFDTYIIAHPGLSSHQRANSKYNDIVLPRQDYQVRNRYIVKLSQILLAFPRGPLEEIRSGTWSTVRYAKRENSKLIIIGPDGEIIS